MNNHELNRRAEPQHVYDLNGHGEEEGPQDPSTHAQNHHEETV